MPHELEYIVKDALMMCDKGTIPVKFNPTSNQNVKINGCLVSNKLDKQPIVNIPPCGACSLKNGTPCVLVPTEWTDTYDVKVKGQETLLLKSKMQCGVGGKLEFITSGQVPIPQEEMDALMEEHSAEEDSGWGWWDTAELIPVVGNIIGMVRSAKKGNWGMFALNLGFLALDVFTLGSASLATAGVKGGIKAGLKEGTKVIAKGTAKALTKGGIKSLAKGIAKKVDSLAAVAKVCVFACFPEGTKIETQNGAKRIEQIQVGDLVWSYDEVTERQALKRVTATVAREVDATIVIELEGENIETTAEHPFFTKKGWKKASQLTPSDYLQTKSGDWHPIKSSTYNYQKEKVYNFEVEDFHTYFVGALMWLVHNAKVCMRGLAKAGVKWAKNILNGQMFDKAMRAAYGAASSQIKMANDKILDVLTKNGIISHKFTQLSDITFKTAKSYIDEIGRKYANQMTNSKKLAEQVDTTDLKKILEIPPQKNPIPKEILEHADKMGVEIREISGKALEEFNKILPKLH